ncbi:MAG: exosortase system-associated protein, TIGR04073 family [Verrucomicrobia subdivision 3 bacterium]|nr:exosortase system-associated protein, TIGR04073 family [Limisphaerales bacterium]
MRVTLSLACLALAAVFCGCAGPERKFGRGFNNVVEFARGGEMRRSLEQHALWEGPDVAYTTGFVRGFNRSLTRTAIGAYEMITAPLPPYGPLLDSPDRIYPDFTVRNKKYPWGGMVLPEVAPYPDVYKPAILSDSVFATDTALGFRGGDVAPIVPGSRFNIFDN